ncbi:SgcJ/EcaC family oxidoreductase [Fibrisoma montanum]|uniref:SgcJ/EcaC family oxidoreductase n=1 Tax=Fibrisoma montanum TaxID=2305895 RepID=A0A418MBX3_9BACT|nr:SgcJ/EcaC family oxidoreductase [Fibrisoma montanum]RIV23871.1 SgcJ/EcaC family oxidoreductase [Fibrisoma montanum]
MNVFYLFTISFSLSFTFSSLHAQSKADTLALQTIISSETEAWNQGDAVAYSRHFAQDGTFTNIAGMFMTGHPTFLKRHDDIFKGIFYKTVLQQTIVSMRFIHPDVATVETLCRVTGFTGTGPAVPAQLDAKGRLHTRLLQVLVRQAGAWQIVSYHNVDVKPGVPIPE